ncbi:MAG: NAD(P)/FAD-dependent oxidoreductase [Chloroflexi bacterium]|nr:NAD(P)/FAD-dependent oxidoreductase [Chloroflexota bacterium]
MTKDYDVIIIGAGHNGLTTAALLAKQGLKILVLEQRNSLGGSAGTEEIFPGFKFNTGAVDAGLLQPEVIAELNLKKYGLEFILPPVLGYAPQVKGNSLTIWRDPRKTASDLAHISESDANKFPDYANLIEKLVSALRGITTLTPPNITQASLNSLLPWVKTALNIKRLGDKDMVELLRILPMTAVELLDEWFESDLLKGVLGAQGVSGSMQGPQSSGTAFMMLYQQMGIPGGGFKSCRFVRGGIGNLSAALSKAARLYGAEIQVDTHVEQILVKNFQASGVMLSTGEKIASKIVVSNTDAQRTLLEMLGPAKLEPREMRRVRNIKFRGSTAKLNLALQELPEFVGTQHDEQLSGHIIICPNLEYLERAYDDAKYGNFSDKPYLDIVIPSKTDNSLTPTGQHVMSVTMQFAPYNLRGRDWEKHSQTLEENIIDTIAEYAPGLKDIMLHSQMLTPLDLDREYSLTEGSIYHGQMGLDQLLFMRPIAGYGQYQTPIENLYLCGAGTHPGGGVTAAPGYNAAREILKNI